jgi:hypothetical protein
VELVILVIMVLELVVQELMVVYGDTMIAVQEIVVR